MGGLAAAIRLAASGHAVALFERNAELGGKLAVRRNDGFTFDVGPSLLTLPGVFDDLLRRAGTSLAAEVPLVRLDPAMRYRFADGAGFDAHDRVDDTVDSIEAMSPGSGEEYRAFLDRARRTWEVAQRTFFAGPMTSPAELARRLRTPSDLVAIDGVRTLAERAGRSFTDPRLRRFVGRYATYTGSSPYEAPATLACIPWIEASQGCWYVSGGLGALRDALVRAATTVGVQMRTGTEVVRVDAGTELVRGVTLADGEGVSADVVVSDVDALHLYTDLLPDDAARARTARAPRSSSGFVLLLGVDGETPMLAHHNVSFSADERAEFDALFGRGGAKAPVADPTVYVCCSSRTDPTQAPPGAENWFVLVNAPSGGGIDWEVEAPRYRDHLLDVLEHRGWSLAGRVRTCEVLTPDDLARRYRSPGGAIYGSSSNGRRAAFLRPPNRGARAGLYLVGGSSHPGGGLPLVAISGAMVADVIDHEHPA